MMAERCCVVVGAGRIAGGFAAPILREAGWRVVLVCRDDNVRDRLNARRGVLLHVAGERADRWIDGVMALHPDAPGTVTALRDADFVVTAVGPSSLPAIGRWLAAPIAVRFDTTGRPINVVLFENSRQAQTLLTQGLLQERPELASVIGAQLGVGGAAVWRTVSRRDLTPAGVRFTADRANRCSIDGVSLLDGVAPLDGSLPGLHPVRGFDDRITEKLWLFNTGHAAAAYLGWHAGCETISEALGRPAIREATLAAMTEAEAGFRAHLRGRPGSTPPGAHSLEDILGQYANPALDDPVTRVGREPRRKLAFDDRIIGPATACLASGIAPSALADVAAATLAYGDPGDRQAADLRDEIRTAGAREVLASISSLDPHDELVELILARYERHAGVGDRR